MLWCTCAHTLQKHVEYIPPTSVSRCSQWLSVVSSPNLHFGVCGKKPHQSISPLRCGPLVEQSQVPLQKTTSGIHYYFQIFPDFIQLNSAETPVLPFTQKNISNPQKIRNTSRHSQTLRTCQHIVYRLPVIFSGFLEFFLAVLHVLHLLLVMIPFKEAFYTARFDVALAAFKIWLFSHAPIKVWLHCWAYFTIPFI